MNTQKDISRKQFDKIEAEYREALLRRRNKIIRQIETMTVTGTAKYWGLDISRITRIVNNPEPKHEKRKKAGDNENSKRTD